VLAVMAALESARAARFMAVRPSTYPADRAAGNYRRKMVDRGELNSRHRDFQSLQGEEQPVVPDPLASQEGARKVHTDAGFANERQLDVL